MEAPRLAPRINALATNKKLPNRESRIKTRHRFMKNDFCASQAPLPDGPPLPDSFAGNGGGAALG
jgi:hypothetical protein